VRNLGSPTAWCRLLLLLLLRITPHHAITEAELDCLAGVGCADPWEITGNPLPMVFDSRLVDPALVPVIGMCFPAT